MTTNGFLRAAAISAGAALLLLSSRPAAFAGSASDYCRLVTKEDVEQAIHAGITEMRPWPMKVVLGEQGLHSQNCVFFAGSRTLRIVFTEAQSADQARQTYATLVKGHSVLGQAEPKRLSEIGNEAVLASSMVVMRRQNLVINFSLADFASDSNDQLPLAKALAAMLEKELAASVAERTE